MDKNQDCPKKCFCARCFLPIVSEDDKVDIDGQSFHKLCSTCCICRKIPTSLKMFYGHVFCTECFKNHVLARFKGENPRMHSNSWWMQFAPGMKPQPQQQEKTENETEKKTEEKESEGPIPTNPAEPAKKCICARCLQAIEDDSIVEIGGQCFHQNCARCYFCHCVPKFNVKIYYGQVFCEDCFQRHILNRQLDQPSEFFRNCFDQWQNNPNFAENMKEMMAGSPACAPTIVINPQQCCRCGNCGNLPQNQSQDWFQNEAKKSATSTIAAPQSLDGLSCGTLDLSLEYRTEVFDRPECSESAKQENYIVAAAEKIAKLTKYLRDNSVSEKASKKWKNFIEVDKSSVGSPSIDGWVDLQDPKVLKNDLVCPKCLWQCGTIIVTGDYFKKEICCEN